MALALAKKSWTPFLLQLFECGEHALMVFGGYIWDAQTLAEAGIHVWRSVLLHGTTLSKMVSVA